MHLNETTLASQIVFDGRIMRVEQDTVRLEDGSEANREIVRHSGGVCVLAITEQDEILLVKQFRYPHAVITTEIPAGKLEYGETPETCGKRELLEECGCTADSFTYLGKLFPTPAYSSEVIRIYLAEHLHDGNPSLDKDEFLDVQKMPFSEALDMALHDGFPDSKTQIAILKYALLKNRKPKKEEQS